MTTLLFDHLWQSTLFAGVIALLALALRHNRARLRYGLWLAASVKFLVPFAALAAVGSLVQWQQAPAAIRSLVASPAARDVHAPFAAMWVDATPMATTAAAPPPWIAPLVVAVWACGFAALVWRRVRQWRAIRAAVRASTPFTAVTPVPSGAEIRTVPTILEPGVVGLRRPVILLPEGIETHLTADQLAAVLAHEACHVRRRDSLTAALHMLVEAVFWFHPLVWWIGARLVTTREQACDEHVVAETAAPIAYAEGILSVCRRYAETPLMSVAGVGGADVRARIDAILANRIGLRLTLPKRVVLAGVTALSLVVPVVAGAIEAAAFAAGQLGNPLLSSIDPESRFEVVSIRRSDPSAEPRMQMTPGRLELSGAPVRMVVAMVLPIRRVFGWPDGLDAERYTISARMPDGASQGATQVAIRNLLKDRFGLVTHQETRELPVYNLVLGRSDGRLGPALNESSAECRAALTEYYETFRRGSPAQPPPAAVARCASSRPGVGALGLNGTSIGAFVTILPQFVERQVIDRTGLTGIYDLTLTWAPEPIPSAFGLPPTPLPPVDPDVPNIFTAVQEQLGLKLEPGRGPVEVVIIDRLEKPALD
jgi:bla regulator protein BlaR1